MPDGETRSGGFAELGNDSRNEENSMKRWYIGHRGGIKKAFQAESTPTAESHGPLYVAAIGPFRTKRAAIWGCQYGAHWATIAEAERAAKKDAELSA